MISDYPLYNKNYIVGLIIFKPWSLKVKILSMKSED